MGKNKAIEGMLEHLNEIIISIEEWPTDEFYIARELADQLREELESLQDDA